MKVCALRDGGAWYRVAETGVQSDLRGAETKLTDGAPCNIIVVAAVRHR